MRIKYELFINGAYISSTFSNEKAFEDWKTWSRRLGGKGTARLKFRRVRVRQAAA